MSLLSRRKNAGIGEEPTDSQPADEKKKLLLLGGLAAVVLVAVASYFLVLPSLLDKGAATNATTTFSTPVTSPSPTPSASSGAGSDGSSSSTTGVRDPFKALVSDTTTAPSAVPTTAATGGTADVGTATSSTASSDTSSPTGSSPDTSGTPSSTGSSTGSSGSTGTTTPTSHEVQLLQVGKDKSAVSTARFIVDGSTETIVVGTSITVDGYKITLVKTTEPEYSTSARDYVATFKDAQGSFTGYQGQVVMRTS